MEAIKTLVHTITNHIQGIIGYLEIGEHVKAMKCAREAGKDLRTLSKMLVGYGMQAGTENMTTKILQDAAPRMDDSPAELKRPTRPK